MSDVDCRVRLMRRIHSETYADRDVHDQYTHAAEQISQWIGDVIDNAPAGVMVALGVMHSIVESNKCGAEIISDQCGPNNELLWRLTVTIKPDAIPDVEKTPIPVTTH